MSAKLSSEKDPSKRDLPTRLLHSALPRSLVRLSLQLQHASALTRWHIERLDHGYYRHFLLHHLAMLSPVFWSPGSPELFAMSAPIEASNFTESDVPVS